MSRPWSRLTTLLVAPLALFGACGDSRPSTPPNVILIVLDTVRADHLSCYGYARATTPAIDAFAAGADRYELARSSAPWTLPAHAALFTGRFTFQHRADAFERFDPQTNSTVVEDAGPLMPDEVTLAEALLAERYRTGAIVGNRAYVSPATGLDQGFEQFDNDRKDASAMTAKAVAWLDGLKGAQPFLLFMNYMDAHRPYNSAPLAGPRAAELPPPPPEGESGATYLDALYTELFDQGRPASPETVRKAIDAYDLAIANLDLGLARLFDELKRRGLYDDALIVVCSDHGEYFGEHQLVEHSKDVYEPALRIPLIVKRPGQGAGRVLSAPTSIADVPRLILASLPAALEAKYAAQFPGTARLPMFAELSFSRRKDLEHWPKRFDRTRSAMYVEHYKVIRSSDGQNELYDLAADPSEQRDLYASRPTEARALLQQLQRTQERFGGHRSGTPLPEPTPEELEILRQLGYVGDEAKPPARK